MSAPLDQGSIHAVAVLVGGRGVLIRGRSGADKSRLGEQLAGMAQARGWFGRLVADDRVRLAERHGRLVLSPHPAIAGRLERRGQGIFEAPHEPACVLALVVDLVDAAPRHPDEAELRTQIMGVSAPRLAIAISDLGAARVILDRVGEIGA